MFVSDCLEPSWEDTTYWQRAHFVPTMATSFGKLEEFNPTSGDDWIQYVERMEFYFLSNGVTETDKQRAILLSSIVARAYKILRNLISPSTPMEKSFKQLVEVMKKHFCPPPSEIVQRFKFNTRVRQPGVSVATYIVERRAPAQYCNFGDTLELMLRDRLLCGINDAQIQRRLLAEKSLTYSKAREIALALESAVQGTKDIQHSLPTDPVHTVSQQQTFSSVKCFRCGRVNHKAPQCQFKDTVCSNCNKTGHLAKVCHSKQPVSKAKLPANIITEEPVQKEHDEYPLFTIQDTRATATNTDPIHVTMSLNGKPIPMEIDTSAAVSIMTETKFMEISSEELQGSLVNLCTYSGEKLSVKGEVMCNVEYDGKMCALPLVIIAGNGPTQIGRNWLRHTPLNWSNLFQPIHMVHDQLAQLLQSFEEVFADELGTLQGSKASIYIDPNIPSRFCKAHSLPYAMKEKVEIELQKLETQGIISPVKYSKWAAPIVPVLKQDKQSVRICGDYKLTTNRQIVLHGLNTTHSLKSRICLPHLAGVSCLLSWT